MRKKFKIFYSTCANIRDGKIIAKFLLENKKALCVNLIKNINSFYLDNEKIQNQKEVAILIKTFCTRTEIEKTIRSVHNYDTPIIVQFKTGLPNEDYVEWFSRV